MELFSTDGFHETLERAIGEVAEPFLVVDRGGVADLIMGPPAAASLQDLERLIAFVPACRLEQLGDPSFREAHGMRFACMSGAMANGIGSVEIVEAMGRRGCWASSARRGSRSRPSSGRSTGSTAAPGTGSLRHQPDPQPAEPALEAAVVDLYLRRGVRLVEASAFLNLTLPVVRYRVAGIRRDSQGGSWHPTGSSPRCRGSRWPPSSWRRRRSSSCASWLQRGEISPSRPSWAARIPMAEDITAEADSGGHTDNQPAIVLLPTMLALRDRMQAQHGYDRPLRVGAAGGISTPWAAAAALAMGAAYLVTGSVNQSCVEAGTSDAVRRMLAQAQQADIAMAPAADMFEMGVKVQVLKRGTMFAMRAAKLYELYRPHESLDQIPGRTERMLEKTHLPGAARDDLGADTQVTFASATRRGSSGRSAIPSRRWRWCSAGIWGCRRTGPTPASRRGPSTTRSGAGRPWRPSTTGFAARSSSSRRIAAWRRSRINILYGAAVLTRARIAQRPRE